MAIALFISEQDIKDTTYIDENVDMKLIRDTIELCQDKYVLPLLGTALYNEIVTQVTSSTETTQNHYPTCGTKQIRMLSVKFCNKQAA